MFAFILKCFEEDGDGSIQSKRKIDTPSGRFIICVPVDIEKTFSRVGGGTKPSVEFEQA